MSELRGGSEATRRRYWKMPETPWLTTQEIQTG